VTAGPEEKVRQGLVRWLVDTIKVPANFIAVEFSLASLDPSSRKRADVVVWRPAGKAGGLHPWLLAECKAPGLKLDEPVADQVRGYAQNIKADYVLLTNGTVTRCFRLESGKYSAIENLPVYSGR